MHESRIVSDLVGAAERTTSDPGDIRMLRFRIGALSAVTPNALEHGISRMVLQRWGTQPEIAIDTADDPTAEDALGVTLLSVRVES